MLARLVALAGVLGGCEKIFPLVPPDATADGDGPVDGAGDALPTRKLVFVTSETFTGALGGLAGADAKCQSAATNVLAGTYRAWLSDSTQSARERMTPFDGEYQLVDGSRLATTFVDLLDGKLDHAIDKTEVNTNPTATSTSCENGTGVWTNTLQSGVKGTSDCVGWQFTNGAQGNAGSSSFSDANWTEDTGCNGVGCEQNFSLYCIEQ